MKNLGIVRKLDELGRIVIPKELRDKYELEEGTEIEIYTEENKIILQKHKDACCPHCLTKCEHTDNFCRNCGLEFKTLTEEVKD